MADPNPPAADAVNTRFRPLRIWLPLLLLPCMVLARFIPGWWTDGPSSTWAIGAFVPFLLSLVIVIWWIGFSRASRREKWGGFLAIIGILVLEQMLAHESMRSAVFTVMTVPLTIGAFSFVLILMRNVLAKSRTLSALAAAALAASLSLFLRNDGVWGDFSFELLPRWSKASDEILAEYHRPENVNTIPADASLEPIWPSFRGPLQDGVVRGGPILEADWSQRPPKELWRIPVGAAWSSFSVAGNYLFTQEQRDEKEVVVCYDRETGRQVWESAWSARFFEALGGLGPRGTPTFSDESVYALGADGMLIKLKARTGESVWTADIKEQAGRDVAPMWGFAASPLVINDKVIVHAGGARDKGVLAFNASDGTLAWSTGAGEHSYGSVQVVQLFGKQLLALLSNTGAHFWDLDGNPMLDYKWPHQGYRSLQPLVIDGDKLIIPTGQGSGTRLVQLQEADGKIDAKELWTTRDMKPDFSDVLVTKDYLFGFDNRIFACIDLKTGKRTWKGGHYEKGQAILSADSGLIIVVSEKGKLILLRASGDKHEELGSVQALTDKCWNHPVLIGDRLYLRNAAEAVAYQLPVKSSN